MAREGLFLPLRNALKEAAEKKRSVRNKDIRLRVDGSARSIDLEVVPVRPPNSGHTCFLVLFHEPSVANAGEPAQAVLAPEPANDQETDQLRKELAATKEYLQSVVEQQDAANEELRSANEEVLSANEELQSTNEELETAKEELQSANEELTTINEQLQCRNIELNHLSNDLTNLLNSTTIPVIMVGRDLTIRRFTQGAAKSLNLRTNDAGRPIYDLRLNLDVADLRALTEEAIDQVQVREREVLDNEGRWYSLRIHPYQTTDHKIDGAVIALLDIDDIKKTQVALRQHTDLLELTHEAVFAWTWEGPIVYWNRGASELYGYTAEEALGQHSHALLGTDRVLAAAFEQELERAGHWVGELKHRTKNGREVLVESRQQIVTRSDGTRLVLETNRDITDRKRLERELSGRLEELNQADRHKNEFLATLAHELRNPLAPVLNVVELLRIKDLPQAEQDWCREVLERQLKQMTRMLDDLLDVGRITADKFELRKEPLQLAVVLESAIETSRPHIDGARHKFSVNLPSESLLIEGDSGRLSQVFSNLLNNAAKYTAAGGEISLSAERRNSQAVVRVKDSGIGITAELLPVIFDMFVQEKHSMGDQPSGLGIGLTLVRKLVQLHGGRIEAHSAGRGHGSEFIVTLPLIAGGVAADRAPRTEPAQTGRVQLKRILVVDDREEQTRSLRMLLERMGHPVHVAQDGPSALKLLAEFPVDVALIDIGLEGMDGYELARRIRERPESNNIILIAQTGWGRDEDRRRSREAGFDHHLVKPISRDALQQILQNPQQKT
jgi:two-component system CheB/CheR fusion protein